MHPAPPLHVTDVRRLVEQLRARPFVTIVGVVEGRPVVAQAPALVRQTEGGLVLDFHLSRSNALASALGTGFRAVAVSHGPDAYISPDWYGSDDQVPTWNYISVEAEGPVAAMDKAGLIAMLGDLSAQEEARLRPKAPWTRDKMTSGRFERMVRAIIGARLKVERLEGTWKLGQNKRPEERAGAVAELGDHPIAELMRRLP